MNRVAFNVAGIDIMWYALLICIGVILALTVAQFNSKKEGLGINFDDISDAFLYAFPLAIIGARLYYVFFNWDIYKTNLLEILNFREGGLAIHGGLLGATIGVLIYKLVHKKSMRQILNMADAAVPGIALAQAIGRWGNFINQEAFGSEVSKEFISKFPKFIQDGMLINGKYYHPTFLYESIFNLLVFIVLMILFHKRRRDKEGTILAWYMVLYSVGRFFIEGLRTDSLYIGKLRQAQVISVVFFVLGIIYLLYKYSRKEEILENTSIETEVSDKLSNIKSSIENSKPENNVDDFNSRLNKAANDLNNKTSATVEKVKENEVEVENKIENKINEVESEVKEEVVEKVEKPQSIKDLINNGSTATQSTQSSQTTLEDAINRAPKQREARKGEVKSQGELVEPVVSDDKKVSLKDKIKASREKSKSRVISDVKEDSEDKEN